MLAGLFVTFIAPALDSGQFKELIVEHKTARVDIEVISNPRPFMGFRGLPEPQVEVRVIAPSFIKGKAGLLSIGDRHLKKGQRIDAFLTFRSSHRSDFQFKARLKSLIAIKDQAKPDVFQSIRSAFLDSLRGVNSDAAALVAGLAIGDDSRLSSETKDSFRTVSLTHLTAVSGANCAIVLAVVALLINQLPLKRWLRVLLSLLAIAGYLCLVGPEPSVLRASVMVGIVLLAISLGRKVSPVDALAMSILLLLCVDPQLSIDYGFALSVLATFGLLVLAPKLAQILEKRMPTWLAVALAVTIAAQIACLPILLILQPQIPVYSILANLLAEPLVVPITVLGLLACLLSFPFPEIAGAISYLASVPASWVVSLAKTFSEAPYASLPWFSGAIGIFLAILLTVSVFALFWGKARGFRVVPMIFVVLISSLFLSQNSATAITTAAFYSKNHEIVNCDVGQGDALVIRSMGKVALIDVGRENPAIDECLTGLGIEQIDLLVLTHFDMDHVGGVVGAITGRKVVSALVSSFPDDRPGADFAEEVIRSHGLEPIKAEVGMFGSLGKFAWRVLSPHRGAPEAEDSNDGSIGMIWESATVVLITLADLGEKGQLRIGQEQAATFASGFGSRTVVVKVAHHGSADQASEFYEAIRPDVALISVGAKNSYGHPTQRCLEMLQRLSTKVLRTDQQGAIGLSETASGLTALVSGRS
ncbi:MAG: ComEC/Rec2 family competence protein [Acidobacteria bacterium]|nr:ComEC/Rec2 family competence protein [Acidobacteriota bacterium]